jgi:1,4-alpha-glucan branching enzyme
VVDAPEVTDKKTAAAVELTFFAPYNEEAALIGTFSDWKDVPMEKGEDGVFRATVELEDGLYEYRFRVRTKSWFFEPDSWVTITDPYATDVDPATENGILRISNGRRVVDEYAWRNDGVPLPSDEELIVYELHVGDFSGGEADGSGGGRYTDAVAKLDYLADLGITAVELMPVKEYPGDHSWGYNPRHFFATESAYGTTEELKLFVDECHARGIRVIIDGVYHHSDAAAPLAHVDHDYWYHHAPRDESMSWGPEFNYEKVDERYAIQPAWRFVGDTIGYWVSEYHIDGIRYDAARNIGNFDFMRWVAGMARETAGPKPFYNVAEYLPPDPSVTGVDGPMDGVWNENFKGRVVEYLKSGEVKIDEMLDAIDARRLGYPGPTNVVNYLANHDHERLMTELGAAGVAGEEAYRRAKLGAAILMTSFGIPMLWMGEEFGELRPKSPDRNKIDWRLLEAPENRDLHATYKSLVALRRAHRALRSGSLEVVFRDDARGVVAFTRQSEDGDAAIVVLNLSGEFAGGCEIPGVPGDGVWHEWLRNYDATVEGGALRVDLGPREAHVFVRP